MANQFKTERKNMYSAAQKFWHPNFLKYVFIKASFLNAEVLSAVAAEGEGALQRCSTLLRSTVQQFGVSCGRDGGCTTVARSNPEPLLFAAKAMEAMIRNTLIRAE